MRCAQRLTMPRDDAKWCDIAWHAKMHIRLPIACYRARYGLAGFTPMTLSCIARYWARCALIKTEGPKVRNNYGILVGTKLL